MLCCGLYSCYSSHRKAKTKQYADFLREGERASHQTKAASGLLAENSAKLKARAQAAADKAHAEQDAAEKQPVGAEVEMDAAGSQEAAALLASVSPDVDI